MHRIWSHEGGLILLGIFTAQIKKAKSHDKTKSETACGPGDETGCVGGLGSGTPLLYRSALLGRAE